MTSERLRGLDEDEAHDGEKDSGSSADEEGVSLGTSVPPPLPARTKQADIHGETDGYEGYAGYDGSYRPSEARLIDGGVGGGAAGAASARRGSDG
ncbi:hypothetical protein T492DRAFT_865827 [Pavlovales sp. CCMP2436]|nr:hypothetical protein T492DRAFT_865827 [Pavlovales sp. CCMP2436]